MKKRAKKPTQKPKQPTTAAELHEASRLARRAGDDEAARQLRHAAHEAERK
jgi:hypothetical protein